DGRIGSDPTQSNVEDGGKIVAAAAQAVLDEVRRFSA
ncbi:MAG TPA: amidase, partial [Hyphomonas sp.]|nr:amidase [Hyphomonas sp.]